MAENEKNIPTLEEKSTEAPLEEKKSVFSMFKKEPTAEVKQEVPVIIPSSELVFEITYLDDPITKSSGLAYTKSSPIFNSNGSVQIDEAFGALELKELVLGRKAVERKCRKKLDNTSFVVDCKSGILIKAIEPQAWMEQDPDITRTAFDKEVLETFRIVQGDITKELQEAEKQRVQAETLLTATIEATKHTNTQVHQQHDHTIPVHNPVYNLKPGDAGYNPNNDPNRRGKPKLAIEDSEELEEF